MTNTQRMAYSLAKKIMARKAAAAKRKEAQEKAKESTT